ncbi:tripartite tricarboxylate transporter substrate binding protein [Hydrogenophaga sp.]|uniref:Bug family tripartite tricarboxylate transporter substrate binding protein n=1 Tax=Hydrogenophaga sp. TaxID=1904254 RepID=UPI0027227C19|nr:tripartite tricarboxylate transporter substrate binding protein [Hydrogenophaga sp.]MDO9435286.1 tripartite tricarboxylate transporter substrate binding protein [Hydrogenophaga sp.]
MKQIGRWWIVALALACGAVGAQEWKPTQPVEFVVPSGPGGAADQYGRAMGKVFEKLNLLNGQAWVAVNRPSGTGVVALQALQQKPGNPHVITLLHTGIVISNLAGELKPVPSDFTEVALFLKETMAVTVRADSTIATGPDLVNLLKRDPGSIRFGYIGHHVLMSLVKPLKAAGVDITKLTLVPFRSSAEALTSLLGGHVDAVPGSTPNLVGMVSSGRVRALALSSPERLGGVFAQLPTWKEQGVNASFNSVYGVMLPAAVPPESVRFWENAFLQLSKDPEWLALLERNGAKPFFQDRQQTVAYFVKEREELAPLVKELGLGAK